MKKKVELNEEDIKIIKNCLNISYGNVIKFIEGNRIFLSDDQVKNIIKKAEKYIDISAKLNNYI